MLRRSMMAGLLVVGMLISTGVTLAKPGFVRTNDNRILQGDVTEKGDDVTIKIKGADFVIPRKDVVEILYAENITQEFRDRLTKLNANDVDGRMRLARWAFESKRYDLAREATESALTIDPNNKDAVEFLDTVRQQMILERRAADAPPPADPPPTTAAAVPAPGERKLLTPADINIIRQKEMTSADSNIRIRFDKDVRRRYAQQEGLSIADFTALSPREQADDILRSNDQKLTDDVKIVSDPASIIEYKRLQPALLAGCATAGCHGGAAAGNFQLISPGESEAALYTNFYILQEYSKRVKDVDSEFGTEVVRQMVDRTQPSASLLAEYALPPDHAEMPHPPIPNYKGVYRGRNDPRYQKLIDWMGSTLSPVDPDYGINYKVPGAAPATQPGAGATTQPARK